jgi:hypothetical protein
MDKYKEYVVKEGNVDNVIVPIQKLCYGKKKYFIIKNPHFYNDESVSWVFEFGYTFS